MVDIPLNGRQATQLILLTGAATTAPAGDNVGSKNYPSEVTLSVAGSQGTQTEYLMDGADNTDSFSNVNLPFPFPDAMQEFSVQTSGLAAQYGFHPGSVVNIVTRAGTNAFHGTAFEFLRNNFFNADELLLDPLTRSSATNSEASSAGRSSRTSCSSSAAIRAPSFISNPPTPPTFFPPRPFSTATGPPLKAARLSRRRLSATRSTHPRITLRRSQLVTKYLPLATSPNGHYLYGPPNPNTENQFIGRVDWNKSEKQTLFGRYYLTHYFQPGFFNNNLLNTTNPQLNDQEQSVTLGHTYSISSSLVNSFHVCRDAQLRQPRPGLEPHQSRHGRHQRQPRRFPTTSTWLSPATSLSPAEPAKPTR